MRAASLTSSPRAVTSLRPAVRMRPMYSVAPQCSPNRSDSSDAGIAARGDLGERVAQRSRRDDARSRRGGLRADGFGEEEGDDAVSGVTADNATGIDDALVRGAYQTANEREILRGREDDVRAAKTLPGRPSRSRRGDDRGARRRCIRSRWAGSAVEAAAASCDIPAAGLTTYKTRQGVRERHRSET